MPLDLDTTTVARALALKEIDMKTFLTKYLRPAVVITLLLTLVTGFLYPGIVTGLAQLIFPHQANGSLVTVNGKVVGSELIGQYWTSPQYFHGRASVTMNPSTGTPEPYAADNTTASNAGPTNATYIQTVQERVAAVQKENPDATGPVPDDLVTASGSGLDPDITPAAAYYQAPRVAKARGLTVDQVNKLINEHIQGRFLGIFGEDHINVLDLNMALDTLK